MNLDLLFLSSEQENIYTIFSIDKQAVVCYTEVDSKMLWI